MAALLFARTRGSWAAGWKGGLTFGFFLGLVLFFQRFYDPLVIDGYPYYLSWCQGGINMINSLLAGAVPGPSSSASHPHFPAVAARRIATRRAVASISSTRVFGSHRIVPPSTAPGAHAPSLSRSRETASHFS